MGQGAKAAAVCARVAHVLEGYYMQRRTSHITRHTPHVMPLTRALALWDSCSLYRPLLLMIMSPSAQIGEQLASASASAPASASAAAAWAGVFVRVLCRVTCLNGPFALQALVIACQVTLSWGVMCGVYSLAQLSPRLPSTAPTSPSSSSTPSTASSAPTPLLLIPDNCLSRCLCSCLTATTAPQLQSQGQVQVLRWRGGRLIGCRLLLPSETRVEM
jgi:hypothetical protein